MKTVFITISRGMTARNILRTGIGYTLVSKGFRVVILTPAFQDVDFQKEFGSENIFFEPLFEPFWGFLDNLFVGMCKGLVYNASTKIRDLYGVYDSSEGSVVRYVVKKIVFQPLGTLAFLKEWVRFFDFLFVKDIDYTKIFDKYHPCLLFSTSIMEDMDVRVVKQAKQRSVPIIGMPKSWDNLSKMVTRVKPDEMIVWGPYSTEESIRFQNMKREQVHECGVPQFDIYKNLNARLSREDFCKSLSIDPSSPYLVYASEGKIAKHDPDIIEMLLKARERGDLPKDLQIFIRPHFIYKNDQEKFSKFIHVPGVFIDTLYHKNSCFRDMGDYSEEQAKHLANILFHCSLLITSNSTLTLDAAVCDKPVINIGFDGYTKKKYADSIAKWFDTEYYRRVVQTGAAPLVRSEEELIRNVRAYLIDSTVHSLERKKLVEFFCGEADGASGKRIISVITTFLEGSEMKT